MFFFYLKPSDLKASKMLSLVLKDLKFLDVIKICFMTVQVKVGKLIVVKNNLRTVLVRPPSYSIQQVFVSLSLSKGAAIFLSTVNLPPNTDIMYYKCHIKSVKCI